MGFEPSRNIQNVTAHSERPLIGPAPAGSIGLGSGDPDFRTPEHIRQAMIDAVNTGYSNYPPMNGDPELLDALAWKIQERSGVEWKPEDIAVTAGGSGALFGAMGGYLNPGDKVLIPEPTYSQYADIARLLGAEPVFVTTTPDFHLDLDALRAAAEREGAKMLILNSPNNPTGIVYTREELEGAAQIAQDHNLLVLADEVYDHLIHDDSHFVSTLEIPAFRDRLLYVNSFSKTFAMTGWRLGWIAAADGLLAPASRMARSTGGGVNWALQRAGIAAITGPMEPTEVMRQEYAARRDLIEELMAGAQGMSWTRPQGAFYAFIKYDAPIKSKDMAGILRERGVLLRSGTEYGPSGEGYIRVAFAASRENVTEGMLRLRSTLEEAAEGKLTAS